MEKLKTYGLAIALCSSFAQVARGSAELDLSFNKTHYFTGAFTNRFAGGKFDAELIDGSLVYQLCFGAVSFPYPVGVDPLYCPLGTTGFVAAGDINNDGVQDALSYWSIVSPVPADLVEPFRPEETALVARPSRDLPLLSNFADTSIILYYNLFTPATFTQYNITGYSSVREYAGAAEDQPAGLGALLEMNDELPAGQYVFQYPRLKATPDDTDVLFNLGVNVIPFVEALNPAARYPTGFRFTTGTWDADHYYQMDPRITTKISWTGNTRSVIQAASDLLYFSIYDTNDNIQYPSALLADEPQLLSTPLIASFIMPPLFFSIGYEEEMRLQFHRDLGNGGGVTFDTSVRDFRAKIRMVDSFKGFAALNFPTGASTTKVKPTADYDGDGVSNITEFAAEYPTLGQVAFEASSVVPATYVGPDDPLYVGPPKVTTGEDDLADPMDPIKRKVVGLDYSAENLPSQNLPPVQNPNNLTKALDINTYIDAEGYAVCDVVKRPFTGTSLVPTFSVLVPSASSVPRYSKITPGKAYTLTTVDDDPVSTTITAYTTKIHEGTGVVEAAAKQTFTVNLTKTYWRLRSVAPVPNPAGAPPQFIVTVADNPLK